MILKAKSCKIETRSTLNKGGNPYESTTNHHVDDYWEFYYNRFID